MLDAPACLLVQSGEQKSMQKQWLGAVEDAGLNVKTPWDGKKRDNSKTTHFKDRIQAVHLQCEGQHSSITAKLIKAILASPLFQQRYKCDVRLIPDFDRNSGPYIQDKIRRCITQHGQFCKCVNSNTCEGIDHLDQKNKLLYKTL